MQSASVYDLCRVICEQADALKDNLSRFDTALESMDDDGVANANRNIEILATAMECLCGEVADTLDPEAGQRDIEYGEDELPW